MLLNDGIDLVFRECGEEALAERGRMCIVVLAGNGGATVRILAFDHCDVRDQPLVEYADMDAFAAA